MAQHLEHLGLRGLSTRAALQALGQLLESAPAQVAVADVEWSQLGAALAPWTGARRLVALLDTPGAPSGTPAGADRVERTFGGLDDEARRGLITQVLARVVARVMRTREEELNASQPLRELGMDSIMALEIVTALEGELGVKLSPMEVVSGPSLRELATLLMARLQRPRPAAPLSDASWPVPGRAA